MDVYRTEEEQLEALKRWWDENGRSILIGIVLAVAAVFGWRAWDDHQRTTGEAASELYFNLLESVALSTSGSPDPASAATTRHLSGKLKTDHPASAYAVYAALLAAKLAVFENDLDSAEQELTWATEKAKRNSSVWLIANLRLARVLLAGDDQANAQRALALVEGVDAEGHQSSYDEVKGDIYLKLEQVEDARNAYQAALEAAKAAGIQKPLLAVKLDDLAADGGG